MIGCDFSLACVLQHAQLPRPQQKNGDSKSKWSNSATVCPLFQAQRHSYAMISRIKTQLQTWAQARIITIEQSPNPLPKEWYLSGEQDKDYLLECGRSETYTTITTAHEKVAVRSYIPFHLSIHSSNELCRRRLGVNLGVKYAYPRELKPVSEPQM